jgi:hypothetical protein
MNIFYVVMYLSLTGSGFASDLDGVRNWYANLIDNWGSMHGIDDPFVKALKSKTIKLQVVAIARIIFLVQHDPEVSTYAYAYAYITIRKTQCMFAFLRLVSGIECSCEHSYERSSFFFLSTNR